MNWNYRVMEWEQDGARWRTIHTVYYYDDGKLAAYSDEPSFPMVAEDEDMAGEVDKFAQALTLPTLTAEQFPAD